MSARLGAHHSATPSTAAESRPYLMMSSFRGRGFDGPSPEREAPETIWQSARWSDRHADGVRRARTRAASPRALTAARSEAPVDRLVGDGICADRSRPEISPEVARERGMDLRDVREAEPNAGRDRLPGALHRAARPPAPPAEAEGGCELARDEVELRARTRRATRVVAGLGILDLPVELGEPAAIVGPRAAVEDRHSGRAARDA